jgi:hypothetical protein
MRLFSILIFIFLLSAFSIGSVLQDNDKQEINQALFNVSKTINDIELIPPENKSIPNIEGFYLVIENGIKFIGVLAIEVFRAGIFFGKDNPEYFQPEFIFKLIKWIIILIFVSLLLKPIGYLLAFIIIGFMYLKDKLKKKKE